MIFITDNGLLMQFIPNVIESVEGETPLFNKILPQLTATEQWLIDEIVNGEVAPMIASEDAKKCLYARTVIACEAMARAVPALDLVLTPNGYGVVSNSNVAPASKERVTRLQAMLRDSRDKALNLLLLKELKSEIHWRDSDQARWLRSSYFVSVLKDTEAAKAIVQTDDRWEGLLELREKARPVEQAIAEKWIGQALTARLMATLASDYFGSSDTVALAKAVRTAILDELISGKRPVKNLDRIVNYIRDNASLYPEWQSDPVAELFADKWRFQNKKKSPGYFF